MFNSDFPARVHRHSVGIGQYDDAYAASSCVWGTEPSILVRKAANLLGPIDGGLAIDLGCGEAKNAQFVSKTLGVRVEAVDVSNLALQNAERMGRCGEHIRLIRADAREYELRTGLYDLVIANGIFHCFESLQEVRELIVSLKRCVKIGGFVVLSVFNSRHQDLSGHSPHFKPLLVSHLEYISFFDDWEIISSSDQIIRDWHQHIQIDHVHSITRILARRTVRKKMGSE